MNAPPKKTLVLVFHPDLSRSKANAALMRAARAVDGVEVVDMQARYPTSAVDMGADAEQEAARLLSADRIVLQFPVQWYATPALLKAWADAVLTRMFYLRYEAEGRLLEGAPLMIACSTGAAAETYRAKGRNGFSIKKMLTPLRMTARRCGLPWCEPFVLHDADALGAEALEREAQRYAETLAAAPRLERPSHDTLRRLEEGTPLWFVAAGAAAMVGVSAQFALAFAALTFEPNLWTTHQLVGALTALPLLALCLGAATIARLRGFGWWALACAALYVVQVALAPETQEAAGLHPWNGALLLLALLVLLGKIRRRRRAERKLHRFGHPGRPQRPAAD